MLQRLITSDEQIAQLVQDQPVPPRLLADLAGVSQPAAHPHELVQVEDRERRRHLVLYRQLLLDAPELDRYDAAGLRLSRPLPREAISLD